MCTYLSRNVSAERRPCPPPPHSAMDDYPHPAPHHALNTPTTAGRTVRLCSRYPTFVSTATVFASRPSPSPPCPPAGCWNNASCTYGSNFSPTAGAISTTPWRAKIFISCVRVIARPEWSARRLASAAASVSAGTLSVAWPRMSATSNRSLTNACTLKMRASSSWRCMRARTFSVSASARWYLSCGDGGRRGSRRGQRGTRDRSLRIDREKMSTVILYY